MYKSFLLISILQGLGANYIVSEGEKMIVYTENIQSYIEKVKEMDQTLLDQCIICPLERSSEYC